MEMFQYLFLTLGIEIPVLLICCKKEWKTAFITGVLINCFTWPVLTLLLYYTSVHLLILEAGVCITEAVAFRLFMNISMPKAFLVSFAANAASLLIGAKISGLQIL